MVEHIKRAVLAAEGLLNWKPEQNGHLLYNAAQLQASYSEAAMAWNAATYPQTQATVVAWIAGKSAAEAALLWLHEISLAIDSLRAHEHELGRPLTESEGHKLLREALREWYSYNPSRMDVVSMRMRLVAEITIEAAAIVTASQVSEVEQVAKSLSGRQPAIYRFLAARKTGVTFTEFCEYREPITGHRLTESDDPKSIAAMLRKMSQSLAEHGQKIEAKPAANLIKLSPRK